MQQQPLSFSPTSSTSSSGENMTSMMPSAGNPFLDLSEQLGYVQCSFCTTILLVSVPCSSLLKVVTVRCGHCTGLLSVSLLRTSIVPVELLDSLNGDEQEKQQKDLLPKSCSNSAGDIEGEEDKTKSPTWITPIINKPPEKRQRAPSAYNRFIREEILRIKARDPSVTHKEAFSAAAKNRESDECQRKSGLISHESSTMKRVKVKEKRPAMDKSMQSRCMPKDTAIPHHLLKGHFESPRTKEKRVL